MIYKALEVILIFGAGRADGRTDEGVLRGPRGPKNYIVSFPFANCIGGWHDNNRFFLGLRRPNLGFPLGDNWQSPIGAFNQSINVHKAPHSMSSPATVILCWNQSVTFQFQNFSVSFFLLL